MGRLFLLLALTLCLSAEDRWIEYRTGPFQVWSSAGERSGKETLGRFEQLRWALGKSLGYQDLKSVWPIRILVFKKYTGPTALAFGRDAYTAGLIAGAPIPHAVLRDCAKILIEANTGRLPRPIERGLEDLFSTLEVKGVHITLGTPPAQPNRDWAVMQLLSVNTDYYGKLPVLIHNLEQGMEIVIAYRNAFGKTQQEIDKQADAYLAAGQFPTTEVSGKPLNAERDFEGRPVDPAMAAVAVADLAGTREAYAAVLAKYPNSAGAHEGLGEFAAAVDGSSQSAHAWVEYARREKDRAKARAALEKAAQLNPDWAGPWVVMAEQASDVRLKIKFLQNATRIEPRNAGTWRALAEADLSVNDYSDAAKAWAGAERASVDATERAKMIKARTDIEQQRLDYEQAERKRAAAEKEREIQNLKNAALERIKEAETKTDAPVGAKVVPWWDGPQPPGKVTGVLLRVECLGKKARLVIQKSDRTLTRLLVPDPSQIVIQGAGDSTLGCGEQRPQRKVTVAYFPKADRAAGTVGEAAQVDFAQ